MTDTPLLWLAVTLAVFAAADALSRRLRRHPLAHPMILSTPALIAILLLTDTPYAVYADDTALLTFLLGPATVALAVPLWRHLSLVRAVVKPLLAALLAGTCTAVVSAVGIAWAFGAPAEVLASLAPRSTTTPVAIALATGLGGIASLAAIIAVASGLVGAMAATPLLNALSVSDPRARGLATGIAAHGIGTARAFEVSEVAGTFSGIGMALSAVTTALILALAPLI
ncbi:MAG: LrgB family protein [Sphingomonadaceae bacterium]